MQTPVESCGLGKPARRRTTRAPKAVDQDRNHASEPEAGRRSLTGLISLHRDTLGGSWVGESKDARLLVLGARGHRGLERLLVGSVGHYCLSHAFCPVVWVRRQNWTRTRTSRTSPSVRTPAPQVSTGKMPSRQAAYCVRNCVTTDHETPVPSQTPLERSRRSAGIWTMTQLA